MIVPGVAYRESFESCPRCGVGLEDAGRVRACPACLGQWVLEPVLAEMLMAMLPAGVRGEFSLVPIAQRNEPTACPTCGVAMDVVSLYRVEIERCPKDHGLWFDPAELQSGLMRHAENPAQPRDEMPPAPPSPSARESHESISAPTHRRRELQRLLVRMGRTNIGGGYEAWEGQGAQHSTPEEQAAIRADAKATLRQHDRDKEALLALIASTDHDERQAWADAHEKYFSEYLSELAAKGEANSIAAEVATRGLDEWAQVRAGKQPYSGAYVEIDEARYRRYFGIDPRTLDDV